MLGFFLSSSFEMSSCCIYPGLFHPTKVKYNSLFSSSSASLSTLENIKLTFLFESCECSYWIRSVPVHLWRRKRRCCCHNSLLLASLDSTLEIILVKRCHHVVCCRIEVYSACSYTPRGCVCCLNLHNVLAYLNMRT